VLARFLRAIPDLHLGLLASRPAREHYQARVKVLFGADAAALTAPGPAVRDGARELDVLAHMLRRRSGSVGGPAAQPRARRVTLEEHAGVEEEVEAAARAEQNVAARATSRSERIYFPRAGSADRIEDARVPGPPLVPPPPPPRPPPSPAG
jgi:hypothetical protein